MSPPGHEEGRPRQESGPVSSTAPSISESRWRREWARVCDRRRAAHELDWSLGVPTGPDLAQVYGLTAGWAV